MHWEEVRTPHCSMLRGDLSMAWTLLSESRYVWPLLS